MSDAADRQGIQKVCKMLTGQEQVCKRLDTRKLKEMVSLFKSGVSLQAISERMDLEVDLVRIITGVTSDS